jgi:hypothetical protein
MDWEYNHHVEYQGKTYHVWKAIHREGYTAWAITAQPETALVLSYVKPIGTAHYVDCLPWWANNGETASLNVSKYAWWNED